VTLPTADDIQHMFDHLTRNSAEAPPSTYPGISRLLPDGTRISLRNSSGWGGPTIDVVYPDGSSQDVHLPIVSGPPNIPPVVHPPPVAVPPAAATDPANNPLLPTVVETPLLPPELQNASPPGFQLIPGKPLTMPWHSWYGLPAEPVIPAPTSAAPPAPASAGAPFTLPSPPPISPGDAAQATTVTAVGGFGLLALLALLSPT
jgi:hypothetical protein